MDNIVEMINARTDVCAIEGCTDQQIEDAEKELGIQFPEEYKAYVKAFGCIDFNGHEWTGLNIAGRLNTVKATKKEMKVNDSFPNGCFVLEDLGIDARKVLVDEQGCVWLLQYEKCERIAESISAYFTDCEK